ncbi:MAG: ribosomal RNA small subunit methyltransferase A [Anaerolineae bacterium]|nr:ribosomal RNA small subunit methyltransferase A [Anaerolineae bacterium]
MRPSKGLGQNFLLDEGAYRCILKAAELAADDLVLEIGPGVGSLTRRLAEGAGKVVTVELDVRMCEVLRDVLQEYPNVHLVEGDILKLDPVEALCSASGLSPRQLRYKVVANLPYYITSAVLRHLLGARVRPALLVLTVQKEVAQRIVAAPGRLSMLAISVQVFGEPQIVCRVPARAFYPRPKVDSAVLRVRVYPTPLVPEEELPRFFKVVRAGFAQKRKQIHNCLVHGLLLPRQKVLEALQHVGISPARRAQMLTIEEWLALSRALPLDEETS